MSERSTSTCRPGRRLRTRSNTSGSRKSPCTNSTPMSSGIDRMSVATTRPRAPTRRAAYWLHAPGAAPRSRHTAPGFRSLTRRSISSSLNTARERQPSLCALCTKGSAKCSFSQRALLLERRFIDPTASSMWRSAAGHKFRTYNAVMEPPVHPARTPPPLRLSERQRRHLRALAHELKPGIRIGNAGLTAAVTAEAARALEDHELIKVKGPGGDREARDELFA